MLLHGPSGAGKSTLLNLISGILRSSEGKLEVMGKRLDKMNERERDRFRANNVGYVFQSFNLFPFLNAYENVNLSLYFSKDARSKRSKQEIENLLRQLNLSKSDCAKPIRKLSIGQQQRVAIARSLIKKPGLLIADEPTSSLDEENRNQFMSVLLDLINEQDTTLLFVSHDLSLRQHFNRVEALAGIHQDKNNLMVFLGLAFKSLISRRGSVVLTCLAMSVSIFVILGVEHIRTQAKESFYNTVSGADLIVGARTGSANLLLYSVFRIGSATNNVSWESYSDITADDRVKWAIPISLGDSHKGYRVMGTTLSYFEHYSYGKKKKAEIFKRKTLPRSFRCGVRFSSSKKSWL